MTDEMLNVADVPAIAGRTRLLDHAKRVYATGLFHLFLSTASVQGLSYLAQMGMARLLSPTNFGVARETEATLSILAALSAFGMPSLAIKAIAHTTDRALRARTLGALLTIVICSAGLVALATWRLAPLLIGFGATTYLPGFAGLLVFVAVSRTCQNYFQGIKEFQRIAVITMALTGASLSILLLLVKFKGLSGWVWGRYLAEGLFTLVLFGLLRGSVSFRGRLPASYSVPRLLFLGGPICLGLLSRVCLDNSGMIALGYFHRPRAELGACGLAILIATAAMLLPSAVSAIYLPRLAEATDHPNLLRRHYAELRRAGWAMSAALTALLLLVCPLIPLVFGAGYRPAVLPLVILSFNITPRTLASFASGVLLARDRSSLSAGFNLGMVGVAVGLYGLMTPRWGAVGTAGAILILDTLSMLYFLGMAEVVGGWRIGARARG